MRSSFQHGCVVVSLIAVFATGYRGIDFGGHWDEPRMQRTVQSAVLEHRLLPGSYRYPSVSYGLVVTSLLPEIISQWGDDNRSWDSVRETVFNHEGKLRARTLFLSLTLLSVVWVYLAVLSWRKRWAEALLAAVMLGVSWEVAYHARWIAPDGILMQFAALFILTMVLALAGKEVKSRWLTAAAVVAGLACGTKYPGGILLVPLLFHGYKTRGAALTLRLIVIFAVTAAVTTPGALFEFGKFARDVGLELRHYATGHLGYSVSPGPGHIALMSQYLALAAFSRYWPIALLLFSFAAVGLVRLWKEDRRFVGIMLWMPLAYFLYIGMQRVMFVRNLMVLMPVLAMLSARGIMWAVGRLPGVALRSLALVVVGAAMVVNFAWLVYASNTIANRDSFPHIKDILAYIDANRDERIFVSANVVTTLMGNEPLHKFSPDLTRNRSDGVTRYLVDTCDGFDLKYWPGNRFGRWHVVSGPFEVNFNYYPTWGSHCRILALDAALGEQLGTFRGEFGPRRKRVGVPAPRTKQ